MMFTCSALRCSVLEGSAISGTSADPGADDPPAPQGIPDAVLYITVDDETFCHMFRDFEHATKLSLDAPCDIGPRRGGDFDWIEVLRPCHFEQGRIAAPLPIRGGQDGDIARIDHTFRRTGPSGPPSNIMAG